MLKEKSNQELDTAFSALSVDGEPIDVSEMAEYFGIEKQSVYRKVKKHDGYQIVDGTVSKKTPKEQ